MTASPGHPGGRSVFIVDDDAAVRASLADLIGLDPGYRVVGSVGSAAEAMDALQGVRPTLMLVDLILGEGPNGIELTRAVKRLDPSLPVLMLSGCDEALVAEYALIAGTAGYVMKHEAVDVLFDAMACAIDGGVWMSAPMRHRLLPTPSRHAPLSEEPTLVKELRRGNRTPAGLATALDVLPAQAERRLDGLQHTLGLRSRAALLLYIG